MSIFNRRDDKQTTVAPSPEAGAHAGHAEQLATRVPAPAAPRAATAPGVVPPPAAPMYSFADAEVESPAAQRLRLAREAAERAQASIQGSLRVAVERTRTSASVADVRGRATRHGVPSRAARTQGHMPIDPRRFAQTGLLNLAWSWQQAGAPIRAIHAYMQLLERYPGTPAAAAAVADLVELSDKLANTGQYHIALGIYDQLEELLA